MRYFANTALTALLGFGLLTSCASETQRQLASVDNEANSPAFALKRFRDFATSVAVNFGEPKGSQITFDESKQNFDLFIGQRNVGSADLFERCLASLPDKGELALHCFYGVTGKIGKREVAVDPQINADGYPVSSYEGVNVEPHFKWLIDQVKSSAKARQAIGAAMLQNGCHKIELGGAVGAITWISQMALEDEDSGKLIAGAESTWRAALKCRDNNLPVYLDVTEKTAGSEIQILLTPVRASAGESVLIGTKE
ncbi:MAG: hypothetical protein ACXWQO_02440 [Bdellovibrionota bacterium]